MKKIKVGYGKVKKISIGSKEPLVFIGGPCAIESKDHTFLMAEKIKKICENLELIGYLKHAMIRIVDLPQIVFMD